MFLCPNCHRELSRIQTKDGVFWACAACSGRAINLGLLRKEVQQGPVNQLWRAAFDEQAPQRRPCPACHKPMFQVPLHLQTECFPVDVCKRCQFLWFDRGEFETLPLKPPQPLTGDEALPQAARERLALWKTKQLAEQEPEGTFADEGPEEWWQQILAILGLPVEIENPVQRTPLITWALVALTIMVNILAFANIEHVVQQWGLIPSQAGRLGGLTWLTAFFLHGGVLHLLSNMYFLLVFGDNVEEFLGRWRFLLLILTASLLGDALHVALDPHLDTPSIGASGGISGVIVFYALQFPRARLGFLVRFGPYFRWATLSASVALVLWVLLQVYGALSQMSGFSNVSSLAHLGGAAVGFAYWLVLKARSPA